LNGSLKHSLTAVLVILFSAFLIAPSPYAAGRPDGITGPASRPVPMIAEPYDEIFRIDPPPVISALGLMNAATATITVNYVPGGGTGTWGDACEAWTPGAQAAFDYAAGIWATQVASSVPIVIEACWTNMGSSSILGHGGYVRSRINFTGATVANTWYPIALANALYGSDLEPAYPDIAVAFNKTFSWYLGTAGTPASGQYDFVSVVLHEIGHGLGFTGTMDWDNGNTADGTECDGIYGHGCWDAGGPYPDIFDRFSENGSGQSLLNETLFPNPSAALGSQLTSGSVFFGGPNADAANTANGQGPVKLYAPAAWSPGSSYAHLDNLLFRYTENALMVYLIPSMTVRHSPGPVLLGILRDMGWTTATVCTPVKIVRTGGGYDTLQAAYPNANVDNDVIQMQAAVLLTGPFDFSGGQSVTLGGGYDCAYSSTRFYTFLSGIVTIEGGGAIIADNLIIM